MKALFYTGTQASEIRTTSQPAPQPGEVLIKVSHCGICGSDMHAWHGHDARRVPPMILGHEAVGVAETGAHSGKRVAINPLVPCGNCSACQSENEHLCPDRDLIGMKRPGAFAEWICVPEQNLVPLESAVSLDNASLAEPLACAVHAVRLGMERLKSDPGTATATVLGGGAIGLLGALVFQLNGFQRIAIAETNPLRAKMLQSVMDADVFDPRQTAGPENPHIILDAVGTGLTRKSASQTVRAGGTIVHIGLQDSEPGLDTRRITLQEIDFIGTYCYTRADFREAVTILENGEITRQGWSEIRPLSEGASGFQDIHDGNAPPKIILEMPH